MSELLLQLEDVDTYYGQIHILQGVDLEVGAGRARLPARRQRLGQVDDAEDDPRDRRGRARARSASRARSHAAPDQLTGSRAGMAIVPGEPARSSRR